MKTLPTLNDLPKICPVCGYDKLQEPPYDEYGLPSHEICSCCGFEYGFDDGSERYAFDSYREKWISSGFAFFSLEVKPDGWGREQLERQLHNTVQLNYKPRI